MSKYCQWLTHNGKQILVQDYRGCVGPSFIAAIRANEAFSLAQEVKSGIRVLIDVTGAYGDRESLQVYKQSAKQFRNYFDKRAVVGVDGVLRFFMEIISSFAGVKVVAFDTREQALDWLASEKK